MQALLQLTFLTNSPKQTNIPNSNIELNKLIGISLNTLFKKNLEITTILVTIK